MSKTVKIEGLRELEKALKELPRATGKSVLRRTLIKAAQPLVKDAEQNAPRASGHLAKSIDVSTKLTKSQKSVHRKMFRSDKASVEVFAGAGGLPQAHLREFGSDGHKPAPFMRPAWDRHKRGTLDRFKTFLAAEIAKSAERLARKAARLAAKK